MSGFRRGGQEHVIWISGDMATDECSGMLSGQLCPFVKICLCVCVCVCYIISESGIVKSAVPMWP